jgi:hypothetical protein
MATVTFDPHGSASHVATAPNLIATLAAGTTITPLAIAANGRVNVDWDARLPIVVVAPKASIQDHSSLRVTVTFDPDGANTPLPEVRFGPFTEAGAAMPACIPDMAPGASVLPAFTLALTAFSIPESGPEIAVPAADVAGLLEAHVIEGNLGRLIYAMHFEKARIRRVMREVSAARNLHLARRDALDRIGGDLGVLRFNEDIAFDAARNEIVTLPCLVDGQPARESDADYQARLQIYRPFRLATRRALELRLNGPGDPATANDGLLALAGYAGRVKLEETNNVFAIAVKLIDIAAANRRVNFLLHLRQTHLIGPADNAANNALHAARYIPTVTRQEVEDLRASLRQNFAFANDHAISAMLARALDRAGRVVRAFGIVHAWPILRAQDDAGGSRYELGLGVDVTGPDAALAGQLVTAARDVARAITNDAEAESLIAKIVRRPIPEVADDPACGWLWQAAGLQTVHPTAGGALYLSHLPTFGLAITAPNSAALNVNTPVEGHYHAPGDPGGNAALVEIVAGARQEWVAGPNPNWTDLTHAQAVAMWANAVALPDPHPARAVFTAAGMRQASNIATTIGQLDALPASLIEAIQLPPALAAAILAGDAAAGNKLGELTENFRRRGLPSALAIVTGANEVLLVLSVISLPEVGLNLGERRVAGIRWYVVPVGQTIAGLNAARASAEVDPFGSTPSFRGTSAGLVALIALGYARRGFTDPYEFRVEPPDGQLMSLKQYEYLMNFLQHTYPVGIEVNTYALRQFGVDLDGDGASEPLSVSVSRTYRKFRNRRLRGIYESSEE